MYHQMSKRALTLFLAMLMCVMSLSGSFCISAHAATTVITAQSTESQTVKSGPSYSYYTDVGSISAGEGVIVLGAVKNEGWYHIRYNVGNTGNMKCGYVPSYTLTNLSATPSTEIYNGGERISTSAQTVWSCDLYGKKINIGSISANEPVTLLYEFKSIYNGASYNGAYIEYSTSNGTKRGYLYNYGLTSCPGASVSSVARMINSATVYGGPSTSNCHAIGSIGKSEFVTVVAKEGDWVCVEYNTNNGRKRGFLSSGYLDYHRPGLTYSDFWNNGITSPDAFSGIDRTVFAGPSDQFATLGTIKTYETTFKYYTTYSGWDYISFKDSDGKWIYGWAKDND